MRGASAAAIASCLAAAACGGARLPPEAPGTGVATIRYDVRASGPGPTVLDVDATLIGGAERFVADAPLAVTSLEVFDESGVREVERDGDRWRIACRSTCTVRYRLDLDAAAEGSGDSVDVAVRAGEDVVAPASTWLLRPAPMLANVPVEVRLRASDGLRFASALSRRSDGVIDLRSQELSTAGYTAFGTFETAHVEVTRGVVDVVPLGGGMAADPPLLGRWVRDAALSLDTLFGRFPVPRAVVFIAPERLSREVEFGRTLPSGGPSILLFVGARAERADLYRDWILTHELFHLGVPSFWQEGKWLDEGLATYYEPVARARVQNLTEEELWREMVRGMPRGLRAPGDPGLLETSDRGRVYWGGAIFALVADLGIRERTAGARSLDDGLRAVLERGGDATHVWTVERFLRTVDEAAGVPVMAELYERAAAEGSREACSRGPGAPLIGGCPGAGEHALAELFEQLGIAERPAGQIAFLDDAPLSALRRSISERDGGRARAAHLARRELGSESR